MIPFWIWWGGICAVGAASDVCEDFLEWAALASLLRFVALVGLIITAMYVLGDLS